MLARTFSAVLVALCLGAGCKDDSPEEPEGPKFEDFAGTYSLASYSDWSAGITYVPPAVSGELFLNARGVWDLWLAVQGVVVSNPSGGYTFEEGRKFCGDCDLAFTVSGNPYARGYVGGYPPPHSEITMVEKDDKWTIFWKRK